MAVETKEPEMQVFDYGKYDPQDDMTLEQWGVMRDLAALGSRLKAVLPGASELSNWQAVSYAQACVVSGANPFRGELYAWQDKDGRLVIDEGFKLLVRWAKAQCDYSEWYVPLESAELAEGDIGKRCYVWRADQRDFFQDLIRAGLDHQVALEICTTSAVGVVKKSETHNPPPKGWTWEQRAEIRALKNALKQAYGGLSMAEIAQESWNVDGVPTQPRDWAGTEHMLPAERDATAAYNAKRRTQEPTVATAQQAINELFDLDDAIEGKVIEPAATVEVPVGKSVDEIIGVAEQEAREEIAARLLALGTKSVDGTLVKQGFPPLADLTKMQAAEVIERLRKQHWKHDRKALARFWAAAGENGYDNEAAHARLGVESLEDFTGTVDEAVKMLEGANDVQK